VLHEDIGLLRLRLLYGNCHRMIVVVVDMTLEKVIVVVEMVDENPKIAQMQGRMIRSRTKQSVDTLQQMVSNILNKAKVEKDEGLEAETLLRILIVAEGPV